MWNDISLVRQIKRTLRNSFLPHKILFYASKNVILSLIKYNCASKFTIFALNYPRKWDICRFRK